MRSFILIIGLLIQGANSLARSLDTIENPVEVIAVTGQVKYREPWASRSASLDENSRVPMHSLVELSSHSTFVFMLSDSSRSGSDSAKKITLTGPGIFRIEPTMIREAVIVQKNFAEQTEIGDLHAAMGEDANLFAEARTRTKAVLTKDASISDFLKWAAESVAKKQQVRVSERGSKIKLYAPGKGVTVFSANFPAKTPVSWKAPEETKVKFYAVYLWRAGEKPTKPYAVTKGVSYPVRVQVPGTYLVQVKTTDDEWESDIKEIHVDQPKKSHSSVHANDKSDWPRPELIFPVENYQILTENPQHRVLFSWAPGNSQGDNTHHTNNWTLWLLKEGSSETQFFDQIGTSLELNLAPGKYRWYVVPGAEKINVSETNHMSEIRELTIALQETSDKEKSGLSFISRALQENKDGTLVLESGL